MKNEYEYVREIYMHGSREVRKALNELANMPKDQSLLDNISSPVEVSSMISDHKSEDQSAIDTENQPDLDNENTPARPFDQQAGIAEK
jgi:hypothetical protein